MSDKISFTSFCLLLPVFIIGGCTPATQTQEISCWAEENQMVLNTDKWSDSRRKIKCTPILNVKDYSDRLDGGISANVTDGSGPGSGSSAGGGGTTSPTGGGGSSATAGGGSAAAAGGGGSSAAGGGSAAAAD